MKHFESENVRCKITEENKSINHIRLTERLTEKKV